MTRHARNSTAGSVYTYHEKKKDQTQSGYGTTTARLGKDSVKNFDSCCLTLQPCDNPVITKEGYLYDKAAILQYLITKKTEGCRQMKKYEEQKHSQTQEFSDLNEAVKSDKLKDFIVQQTTVTVSVPSTSRQHSSPESSISNMAIGKEGHVPSFWIPSKTPQAKKAELKKPDVTVYCPMSGRPLKLKDLIDVKFTAARNANIKGSKSNEIRYVCPITGDALGNSVPCAIIRTTGHVITMDCVEKVIKKDWTHPLTAAKITEKDIIPLQMGATGFAQTNSRLEGKYVRPSLQV